MPNARLRDIKTDLYAFFTAHANRLNLLNPQFQRETGGDLNRTLSWFSYADNVEEAREVAEIGGYSDYFAFCIERNFYSLQIADGSMLQLLVRADGRGQMDGGSLAFVPRPGNGYDYFRFDCEPRDARHYRHNRYHIHFGFHASEMRVSSFQFPWPTEFICLVAHFISDNRGRALLGGDESQIQITAFSHDRMSENLDVCHERYNHSFRFHCADQGGTRQADLCSSSWREQI